MLTATASDAEGAVSRVVFEYRRADTGAWTSICERTAGPYVCTWNTIGLEGSYEVRARATDQAGNSSTSPVRRFTFDRTAPSISMTDPGSPLSGTRTLTAIASDDSSGVATVGFRYRPWGTSTWQDACAAQPAATDGDAWTCPFDTRALENGDYDFQAVATDRSGNSAESTVARRQVRNSGPTVTVTDPGSVLYGSRTITAVATSGVGISSVELQYAPTGSTAWKLLGTTTSAPYAVAWATTSVPDGEYDVRAIATDSAGNRTTSAAVTRRVVDNAGPSVTLQAPATPLTGTVPLTAVPTSLAGVQSVHFWYRSSSASAWTTLGSATTAPYAVSWNTTGLASGSYDVRVQVTDVLGRLSESVTTGLQVTHAPVPLRGADVQAVNGGTKPGWLEAGDSITFTFADKIVRSSVSPAWTSGSLPVTVRVYDGKRVGSHIDNDVLEVFDGEQLTSLGSVSLNSNFVHVNQIVGFQGTMTLGTDSAGRSTVTVTFGGLTTANAQHLRQAEAATMEWVVSPSTTLVTESGGADVDF